MENLVLKTKRVTQFNQEFLLGIFKISDILRFTRYSEYTILGFDEENDNIPITNKSVQRPLNTAKVNSIAAFLIHDKQAIFPTNIVIAIPKHVIDVYDEVEETGEISIILNEKVLNEINKIDNNEKGDIYLPIIDGQHRVRGIEIAQKNLKTEIFEKKEKKASVSDIQPIIDNLERINNFELSVAFFIDPVLEFQAMVFSTINRTQTKVSQDLVYSLFGLTNDDSPQKSALSIVNILNGRSGSPFEKRIRLAGASSKAGKEFYIDGFPVLSQGTMVKSILFMICKNSADSEIERCKPRSYFSKNPNDSLLFRDYYSKGQDEKMLKIIYTYFEAVRSVFYDKNGNSFWDFKDRSYKKPNNILQTTVGYEALLEVLKMILPEIKNDKDEFEKDTYAKYLSKAIEVDFEDNNDPPKFPFANKTKNVLYSEMYKRIWAK
jgi:DGQHR domain-containing protein